MGFDSGGVSDLKQIYETAPNTADWPWKLFQTPKRPSTKDQSNENGLPHMTPHCTKSHRLQQIWTNCTVARTRPKKDVTTALWVTGSWISRTSCDFTSWGRRIVRKSWSNRTMKMHHAMHAEGEMVPIATTKNIRIETCGKKLLRIFYRRSTNAYIKITQLVKRQRKNHIADC